jgi:sugar/nucleoside kinase (ribokinase family)
VAKDFADQMTSTTDVHTALERMLSEGPGLVGITDGIRGSWFLGKGAYVFHQPAFITPDTVDTTGCGDAYHGAFLFAHAKGYGLEKCAKFAAAVASFTSTKLGGRGRIPTFFEVQSFLLASDNSDSDDWLLNS